MFILCLPFRFLALPTLIQAPRDHDRALLGELPRRIYEIRPEIHLNPDIRNSQIQTDLNYAEQYRRDLAKAFAEVYLVRELAAPLSVLHHRPLSFYRDNAKVQHARASCNDTDPIIFHLNPLLQQLGHPTM